MVFVLIQGTVGGTCQKALHDCFIKSSLKSFIKETFIKETFITELIAKILPPNSC